MRRFQHTISVRLSDEDFRHYQRLLRRFSKGTCKTHSERFRSLLEALDVDYETVFDNEGVFEELEPVEDSEGE